MGKVACKARGKAATKPKSKPKAKKRSGSRSGPSGWLLWRTKAAKPGKPELVDRETQTELPVSEEKAIQTTSAPKVSKVIQTTSAPKFAKSVQAGATQADLRSRLVQTTAGVFPYPFPTTWRPEDHLWDHPYPPEGLRGRSRCSRVV